MVSVNDDSLKIGGWLGTNAGAAVLKIYLKTTHVIPKGSG